MIDPEEQKKSARKPKHDPKPRPEIRIWRTQPKVDLLEAAMLHMWSFST
jgi:hypothetical protein